MLGVHQVVKYKVVEDLSQLTYPSIVEKKDYRDENLDLNHTVLSSLYIIDKKKSVSFIVSTIFLSILPFCTEKHDVLVHEVALLGIVRTLPCTNPVGL